MVQAVIVAFLIGAVVSWGFRVWALIPLTLVIFLSVTFYHIHADQRVFSAIGDGLLVAWAPQAGYALGLTVSGVLLALRSPRKFPTQSLRG
jgi:hypothetical protein